MTKLPAVIADPNQRPDPRFYQLAAYLLRGHSVKDYHWARDHLAVGMWMAARNTLDYILDEPRHRY
jgi:hypothetical protein